MWFKSALCPGDWGREVSFSIFRSRWQRFLSLFMVALARQDRRLDAGWSSCVRMQE